MQKKALIITGFIFLSVGLFFALKEKPLPKDSKSHLTSAKEKDPPSSKGLPNSQTGAEDSLAAKTKSDSDKALASSLADRTRKPQERVYQIRDLDLNPQEQRGRENLNELVVYVNSEQELARDPESREHNSYKAMQLKKENSLKVYALKRLNELHLNRSSPYLNKVIKEAKDPALSRIAKQILEHKKVGEDYFESLKQGVLQMDTPVNDQGSGEGSDHEDHDHSGHRR